MDELQMQIAYLVSPGPLAVDLDTIITSTVITFPGGVEIREDVSYRLGDYFDEITLVPKDNLNSLLTFKIKPGVNSMWKYLVVQTLKKQMPSFKKVFTPYRQLSPN